MIIFILLFIYFYLLIFFQEIKLYLEILLFCFVASTASTDGDRTVEISETFLTDDQLFPIVRNFFNRIRRDLSMESKFRRAHNHDREILDVESKENTRLTPCKAHTMHLTDASGRIYKSTVCAKDQPYEYMFKTVECVTLLQKNAKQQIYIGVGCASRLTDEAFKSYLSQKKVV